MITERVKASVDIALTISDGIWQASIISLLDLKFSHSFVPGNIGYTYGSFIVKNLVFFFTLSFINLIASSKVITLELSV